MSLSQFFKHYSFRKRKTVFSCLCPTGFLLPAWKNVLIAILPLLIFKQLLTIPFFTTCALEKTVHGLFGRMGPKI